MMRQLGIQQINIDAEEVIIRTKSGDLVIRQPQVAKVNFSGQETYQVVGHAEERKRAEAPPFTEEDVKVVQEQTGASSEAARKALQENNGDLAEAILNLKK